MAWFKTVEERHGQAGAKGRIGEEFVIEFLKKDGHLVIDHESEQSKQMSGIDLTSIKNGTTQTIDVKTNLNNKDHFAIEIGRKGWLFSGKSDIIVHTNPENKKIVQYKRADMIAYLKERGFPSTVNQLYWITPESKHIEFVEKIEII